jgi:methylthioribose-1-phosphate isomerase
MVIRGAPAIGITAAYGLALEVRIGGDLHRAVEVLLASRPTAVNLRWAVERIGALPPEEMESAAIALHREDVAINKAMGRHGAALLGKNATVYTHCNAGALATGGWGTALGVIRSAAQAGGIARVYAGETRPYLQGARLTAFELDEDGIPVTLITDSTAATVLGSTEIDAVLVGADRVAANGDTANKIGTLGLAILAKHYGVPFYVCVPMSTIDLRCATGDQIPIEERDASEVRGHAGVVWAADVAVFNPAFDVTPAALITGWITENGLWEPTS